MSAFNKEAFLATHVEGQNEVKFTPLEEGDYETFIKEIDATEFGNPPSPALVVTWAFTEQKVKDFLQNDEPTLKQNVFIDLDSNGALQFGRNRNITLGQIREAVGQNTPGPWTPMMLRGAGPCLVKIKQTYDKKTGEGPYMNVQRVARSPNFRA